MEKIEDIKDQTAAGLQYAIEQRKYTEITVNISPTHVIVPEKGIYKKWVRPNFMLFSWDLVMSLFSLLLLQGSCIFGHGSG